MNCQSHSTPPSPFVLTIVLPVFNEVEVLPVFHRRLCAVLANPDCFPRSFMSMTEVPMTRALYSTPYIQQTTRWRWSPY